MIGEPAFGVKETNLNDNMNRYPAENNHNSIEPDPDIPLDMTIKRKDSNSSNKQPEIINYSLRPSVITKAPSKQIASRLETEGISSTNCDLFIEEHFRRSLGNQYASLYGGANNNNNSQDAVAHNIKVEMETTSNEGNSRQSPLGSISTTMLTSAKMKIEDDDSSLEVDDHFAKALGNDTWKKIQEKKLDK